MMMADNLPSMRDHNVLDNDPRFGAGVSNGAVTGLRAMQNITEATLLNGYRMSLKSDYNPIAKFLYGFDKQLKEAQSKVDKAIADLGDGYDPGELTAYVDAEITKISALVSKNAADIASLAVASTDEIVKIVTDGMNGVMQGAAGAAGQVADAFATAFNRMVNALTGKNLGYWDAEVYVASGNVYEGTNDTPLGIYKGFNGKISTLVARVVSATPLGNTPASLTVNILVNGHIKGSVTLSGAALKVVSEDLNIRMDAGDIITFTASGVTGEYCGLSVSIAGVYL
nr:MAG TPA: hypothetical protein [Caudoviricetes sp.]